MQRSKVARRGGVWRRFWSEFLIKGCMSLIFRLSSQNNGGIYIYIASDRVTDLMTFRTGT